MGEVHAEFNLFLILKECYTDMKYKRIFKKNLFLSCFLLDEIAEALFFNLGGKI